MLVPPMVTRLRGGVRVGTPLPEDLQWWQRALFAHFVEPMPAVTKPYPAVTCRMFNDLWEVEREVRCSALAPRWNAKRSHVVHVKDWDAIFGLWDRVNVAPGTARPSHLRRLHAMRLTRVSVREDGCWVYVLWCLTEGRVCIGQIGGRENFRCVRVQGSEHICLRCDFLRVRGGQNFFSAAQCVSVGGFARSLKFSDHTILVLLKFFHELY